VQIVRDKDADGFYVGELAGRRGLVPSNMVSPVDDAAAAGSRAVNSVTAAAGRLADGGDPALRGAGAGQAVSPPSPRRHHRHNGPSNTASRPRVLYAFLMTNSNRPPDTTRRSCLCRVWRCALSLETVWQSLNS